MKLCGWFVGLLLVATTLSGAETPLARYDVVVYGGTSGGVMAAVKAARMGKSVALIESFNCPVKLEIVIFLRSTHRSWCK